MTLFGNCHYCGDYMFIIKHRWTTVMTLHLETVITVVTTCSLLNIDGLL